MRNLSASRIQKVLLEMIELTKKMPDTVRYGRMFIADDGQGLILKEGIEDAAEACGKEMEPLPMKAGGLRFKQFHVGELQIFQMDS